MKSFYFGTSRKLYGCLHEVDEAKPTGVLLCYPGIQEYNPTHWAFRKLAGLLNKAKFPVLRFDYSNTGDSEGDAYDASLDRQVEDIATAADELKDNAGVRRVAVIAMRLGALLAARAVGKGLKVSDLILWEPVFKGATYIDEMERLDRHLATSWLHRVTEPRIELAGYPFPSSLREAIESTDLQAMPPKAASRVGFFLKAPSDDAKAVEQTWSQAGLKVSSAIVHESSGRVTAAGAGGENAVLYSETLTAMVNFLQAA